MYIIKGLLHLMQQPFSIVKISPEERRLNVLSIA